MWLLLTPSHDRAALWAADRLRARGVHPLIVLTPELLHHSFSWQHRVTTQGVTSVAFTLADGRRMDDARIQGVLNRMAVLPATLTGHFAEQDREYVLQEWTALHISWMSALRAPVLNVPSMQGLCGPWRSASEWTWLASRAGLETAAYMECAPAVRTDVSTRDALRLAGASTRTVFVVDGRTISDDLPEDTATACGRLGILSRTRVIGIDLDVESLAFAGASPLPDFRLGGDQLIDALAVALGANV